MFCFYCMIRHTLLESFSVYLVFLIGTFSECSYHWMATVFHVCTFHDFGGVGVGSDTSCFLCILHYQNTPLFIMSMPHYRETPLKVVVSETNNYTMASCVRTLDSVICLNYTLLSQVLETIWCLTTFSENPHLVFYDY